MTAVTRILSAIEQGEPQAAEQLLPLVYGELPVQGPVAFSPDGKRFAVGVVGQPYTT